MRLGAEIVSAYVSRNAVPADAVPDIIRSVHSALAALASPQVVEPPAERPRPAVPIARSVQNDYIVCLEDGKRLKMLKRYLRSRYDMDPDEYRRRWGLPPDYPMVVPAFAGAPWDACPGRVMVGRPPRSQPCSLRADAPCRMMEAENKNAALAGSAVVRDVGPIRRRRRPRA